MASIDEALVLGSLLGALQGLTSAVSVALPRLSLGLRGFRAYCCVRPPATEFLGRRPGPAAVQQRCQAEDARDQYIYADRSRMIRL